MTWGGTGKTPMVEYLAHHFLSAGLSPLILTRGYGGGDEVRLLQKHLQGTSAKFGVGPNRALLALSILHQQAVQNGSTFGADWSKQNKSKEAGEDVGIVILDDGLGNGRIVPRGPLREPLQGFKRAQVVVLHHADLVYFPPTKVIGVNKYFDHF
jgi:tetraacyldisaccharide 4'-kinase